MKRTNFLVPVFAACLAFAAASCGGTSASSPAPSAASSAASTAAAKPSTAGGAASAGAATGSSAPTSPAASAGPASGSAPAAAAPGVSASEIKLGAFVPLSGPLAANGKAWQAGVQARFNVLNEAGGVNGRKITWTAEDDSYDPAKSLAITKRLVEQDKVFMMALSLGSQGALAVLPYEEQQGVPHFVTAGNTTALVQPTHKYFFQLSPSDTIAGRIMADYAVNGLKAKKVGIVYENDDFGKAGLTGVQTQLQMLGQQPVVSDGFDVAAADFSSQVLKVKQAAPDVLVIYGNLQPTGRILREMQAQGVKTKTIGHISVAEPALLSLAGSAAEGLYVSANLPPATSTEPALKPYQTALAKYSPDQKPGSISLQGWEDANDLIGVFQKVGPNLTRESLVSTLNSLKDFRPEGALLPPINFSANNHMGTSQMFFIQVKNGQFQKVSDFWQYKQ